jgi:hypothetical protein
MVYKGIEYEIAPMEPGFWKWQFRIGDRIKSGRTKTNLEILADRRVRSMIDRELKTKSANVQRQPSRPPRLATP